jgi:hypothetical protein
MLISLPLQLLSLYKGAKAKAEKSPFKHAALAAFTPWVMEAKKAAAIQPLLGH